MMGGLILPSDDDDDADTRRPDYVRAPSGLILPYDIAEQRAKIPTGIDLFCGCGGFSLGFIQAGFEIVAAVEWEVESAVTYMSNLCRWGEYGLHFVEDSDRERLETYLKKEYRRVGIVDKQGELTNDGKILEPFVAGGGWISHEPRSTPSCKNFIFGDITKLTGARILQMIGMERGDVGCVMGGPPCQGFSYAGKRDKDDPRNNLVFEFIRLVLEISPKSMVMENVPGILNMTTADGLPIVDVVCRALEDGSFATIDALRKAIAFQTGNVGVLNRQPKAKPKSGKGKKGRDGKTMHRRRMDVIDQSVAAVERRQKKAARKKAAQGDLFESADRALQDAATPAPTAPTQESHMATKKTTKAKAKKKTAKKKTPTRKAPARKRAPAEAKAGAGDKTIRSGTKLEIVAGLLLREEGCTSAEVLEATGWPTVSMPQQAASAGLTLTKKKESGSPTRYWGTRPELA